MVGTDQGFVHKQRQGTGLATLMPKPDTSQYEELAKGRAADLKAAAAQKKAAGDAAWKAINEWNPDRWFKHEAKIQGELNTLVASGAQLLNKGIDPFKSVDPAALAWRKEQMRVDGVARASAGMKELYTKGRNELDGKDPEEFTPDSQQKWLKFFDNDPEEVANNGALPPMIEKKRPYSDMQKTWSGTMSTITQSLNGKELDDKSRWDIVGETLRNPALSKDLTTSSVSAINQMTAAERADLAARAKKMNRSEIEVVNYDFLRRYEKQADPFNLDQWLGAGVKSIEVPTREWRGAESFSKRADKEQLAVIATKKAESMVANNAEALEGYESLLPRNSAESDGEYRARVVKDLSKRLQDMSSKDFMSGLTSEGAGKKEYVESGKNWLADMLSVDPKKRNEAATYVMRTKNILPGQTVNDSYVEPFKDFYSLTLELQGAPAFQKVKEELLKEGIMVTEEDFKQNATQSIIRIPLNPNNENGLLRLHDKAFEETKAGYRGSVVLKPKLSEIMGGGGAGQQPDKI